MKLIRYLCLAIVLLGALSLQVRGEPVSGERLFALPLTETREAVTLWLNSNGYHTLQSDGTADDGRIHLRAQIKESVWFIRLQPHSALATRVEVSAENDENPNELDALWVYLDEYLQQSDRRSKTSMQVIPAPVDKLRKAAVCIYADRGQTPFQLSGFAIDHQGLIATTAHDLILGQSVTIKLHDGRQTKGRVVKLDADRDLSLIQAEEHIETIVSLRNGQYMPAMNADLFACGCPDSRQSLQTGVFYGPPRRVAGQLLWQVRMQIEPGSSGSPVFDDLGRIVAVVKGRYRGGHQIGFLIPFETLLDFMEKQD